MDKIKLRKELARFLKKERRAIVSKWSSQIFRVPGHKRLQEIVPKKMHAVGMDQFLQAFIRDIESPIGQRAEDILVQKLLTPMTQGTLTSQEALCALGRIWGLYETIGELKRQRERMIHGT